MPSDPSMLSAGAPGGGAPVTKVSEFDATKARKQSTLIRQRFFRHKLAVASLVVFLLIVAFGLLGPLFWTISVEDASGGRFESPSAEHPLGTSAICTDRRVPRMSCASMSLPIWFVPSGCAELGDS